MNNKKLFLSRSKINAKYYSQYSGKKFYDFKDLRTYRRIIHIKDCIPKYVQFKTEKLKTVLGDLRNKIISGTKNQMQYKIRLGNNIYLLKNGGLHSQDLAKYVKPKDNEILCEIDVASMYPAIIIENGIYPKHLGPEWLEGYRFIRDDRIKAKHQGQKAKSDAYKLALNGGGFGKTNSEFSWMYDPLNYA